MLTPLNTKEVWFITGSQHLYGPETLAQVAEHSQKIVAELEKSSFIPVKVIVKPTVKKLPKRYLKPLQQPIMQKTV